MLFRMLIFIVVSIPLATACKDESSRLKFEDPHLNQISSDAGDQFNLQTVLVNNPSRSEGKLFDRSGNSDLFMILYKTGELGQDNNHEAVKDRELSASVSEIYSVGIAKEDVMSGQVRLRPSHVKTPGYYIGILCSSKGHKDGDAPSCVPPKRATLREYQERISSGSCSTADGSLRPDCNEVLFDATSKFLGVAYPINIAIDPQTKQGKFISGNFNMTVLTASLCGQEKGFAGCRPAVSTSAKFGLLQDSPGFRPDGPTATPTSTPTSTPTPTPSSQSRNELDSAAPEARDNLNRQQLEDRLKNPNSGINPGGSNRQDCFLPDTKISLRDGSSKRADQIKVGDQLINPLTRSGLTVTRVNTQSYTTPMRRITTADGKAIVVTTQHPVIFSGAGDLKAAKKAEDITQADKLLTTSGWQQVAKVEVVPASGQMVYNFETASAAAPTEPRAIPTPPPFGGMGPGAGFGNGGPGFGGGFASSRDILGQYEQHVLLSDEIVTGDFQLQQALEDVAQIELAIRLANSRMVGFPGDWGAGGQFPQVDGFGGNGSGFNPGLPNQAAPF